MLVSANMSETSPLLNALDPDRISAEERMAELAGILVAGLMRLRARQSRRLSAGTENSSVDFTACQSGHAPATQFVERQA